MKRTTAFILAGGIGSRLKPLVSTRCKPAVPFGGIYRIIDFTLSSAANSGVNHLGVLTQYQGHTLEEHLGNGQIWGFGKDDRRLEVLSPTGEEYMGTADAVKKNQDFIELGDRHDTVLVLSGDHIYNMDYTEMIRFHRERQADVTAAMTSIPIEEAHRFGIATVDHQQRIVGWEEKPKEPSSNLASMGVYVFSKEFLVEVFRQNPGEDFGKHILPFALENAHTYAYPFTGYWRDVGTLESYWQANMDMLHYSSKLDPVHWNTIHNPQTEYQSGKASATYYGAHAHVEKSIISVGCIIEGTVINSVLSPGVRIGKNAVVRNSIVMEGSEVYERATVERSILDERVRIRERAIIGCGYRVFPLFKLTNKDKSTFTVIGHDVTIPGREVVRKNYIIESGVISRRFPQYREQYNFALLTAA